MNTGWFARVLRRLAGWVYRLTGAEVREHIPPPRDRRGRFTSGVQTAGRRNGHWSTEDAQTGGLHPHPAGHLDPMLEAVGVTPRMVAAATPFVRPADIEDLAAFQRALRSWIVDNMDLWINKRICSPYTVFSTLKDSYALDRLLYAGRALPARERVLAPSSVAANNAPLLHSRGKSYVAYVPPIPRRPVSENATLAPRSAGVPPAAAHADLAPCEQSVPPAVGAAPVRPSSELVNSSLYSLSNAGRAGATSTAQGSSPETGNGRAACPRSANLGDTLPDATLEPCTLNLEPLYEAHPHYSPVVLHDPHFDVVANLPQDLRERSDAHDISLGSGNTPDDARSDYIAKHQRQLGAEWRTYTFVPSIFEEYDDLGRTYFVAKPASPYRTFDEEEREEREAATLGASVGTGVRRSAVGTSVRASARVDQAAAVALDPRSAGILPAAVHHESVACEQFDPQTAEFAVEGYELIESSRRAGSSRSVALGEASPNATLKPCPLTLQPAPMNWRPRPP
jgi:hypothetical protein